MAAAVLPTVLPSSCRAVIIGGGVVGSSVAYHLSKLGWTDVVLLEQDKLTSGTTWHAAGLVGATRSTAAETRLSLYGCHLYRELLDETGHDPGYKQFGSVNVARTAERMEALHRSTWAAKALGIEAHILDSLDDVRAKFTAPESDTCAIDLAGLVGGVWLPNDGSGSPTDLTNSLIAGAKSRGVQVYEHVRVADIGVDAAGPRRRATGVVTSDGHRVDADYVVICGGQWSRQIGQRVGINIPLHSAEHFYITTTDAYPGVWSGMPVLRDPDRLIYAREWGKSLLMGGFELEAKPVFSTADGDVPDDFAFQLFDDDWDQFEELFMGSLDIFPHLGEMGVQMLNGPESFTPDGRYILGEAPEVDGCFVAAGMNSSGIASAGGAGLALANWMEHGEPTQDLWPVDIRRFGPHDKSPGFLRDRVVEALGLHYTMPLPRKEPLSARNVRQSPLWERLDQAGAVWGQKFGWERPNFYLPSGTEDAGAAATSNDFLTFGKPDWMDAVRREHAACTEGVAIFDITSFGKLLVRGADAARSLSRLCANNMDVVVGDVVYTGILNDRGGFEADVTVTRQAKDRYLIMTSTSQTIRDVSWIEKHVAAHGDNVVVEDVTGQYAVLGVMGPESRALLQSVSARPEALTHAALPFSTSREIDLGHATVTANRVSYVGELGFELVVPTEYARGVYDTIKNAEGFEPVDAGYYAIESLRLEKGYRAWGHELDPDITPQEAGLSFAVDLAAVAPFNGQEAVLAQRARGIQQRVLSFVLQDSEAMPWGGEPILLDGEIVGRLTSATWGFALDAGVGLGLVKHRDCGKKGFVGSGKWEVQVGSRRVGAKASVKSPCSKRIN